MSEIEIIIAEGRADSFVTRHIGFMSSHDIFEKIRDLIDKYSGDRKNNIKGKYIILKLEVKDE